MSETSGKSKIAAGLLGILLGSFGAHKFYLGYTTPAVIMLVLYLSSFVFAFLFIGFLWMWIPGLIGIIEGIIYLTKSDEDFQQTYVIGKKPWF
ncbi:MAG: TM2 domain-containing protein [Coriobacteriia bacterium]|nr:TM2 domain-containing protein [Coriobacteriia bacterium]MCL2870994.1 TM2 domain-containing protein [Coriobacteriia bacterium]